MNVQFFSFIVLVSYLSIVYDATGYDFNVIFDHAFYLFF